MNKFIKLLISIIIISFAFNSNAYSQNNLNRIDNNNLSNVLTKIEETAKSNNNLDCSFKQDKYISLMSDRLSSSGKIYYVKPNKLRWQYTAPYKYSIILNNGKVKVIDSKDVRDINKNKAIVEISKIILNCINGNIHKSSNLFLKEYFYDSNKNIVVKLNPITSDIQSIMKQMTLVYNNKTELNKIEFTDNEGDKTSITIFSYKINQRINNEIFNN